MNQMSERYIIFNAIKLVNETALWHRRYTKSSQLILKLGDSSMLLAYAVRNFIGV